MELGDATVLLMETSSGEAIPAGVNGGEGKEEGSGGGEELEKINLNGGGGGGNRWPRQETLALLKIRSDMDGVFRDASLKGPLWDEISRKLAQLGYQRSAKKCKEKFENVYKYHRRTKESRSGKSEGKTYRFFDQLQALEKPFTLSSYPPKPQLATLPITTNPLLTLPSDPISHVTVPSTNPTTLISPSPPKPTNVTTITSTTLTTNPTNPSQENNNSNNNNNNGNNVQYSLPNMNLFSTTTTTTTTTSTSSSTASDEDLEEKYRKKRKWKDYFRRLTRQVLAKQEEMQKRFLESIDKREREQMAQQDAWRLQEMARINREHDLLVQERSTAAAKNAAVIAYLQKLSTHQNPTTPQQQQPRQPPPQQPTPPAPAPSPPTISQPQLPHQQPLIVIPQPNNSVEIKDMINGHRNSGSRWPKPEVHALIRLRTSLEPKYLENGPKAPLWEDISAGMQRLGYNRSSKRCKEKWENINKYFKKVKESNKQRREDSKTCPYFHELEALYKEKSKIQNPFGSASFHNMKQNEMMAPLMVQPEQQWRPPPQESNDVEKKNEEIVAKGEEEEEYDDEDEYESMEEDEQGYDDDDEVATNKLSSVDIVE